MLNFTLATPMDFSLSDHQLLIRDTVREFMHTEVRPHVKDWERTDHFPLDAIKKLGALGCCSMRCRSDSACSVMSWAMQHARTPPAPCVPTGENCNSNTRSPI